MPGIVSLQTINSCALAPRRKKESLLGFLCLMVITVSLPCRSQTVPALVDPRTRISGTLDSDVVIPPVSVPLARQDSGALQSVKAFIAASALEDLISLQGSGTLTDRLSSYPATLVYAGDGLRLDISDPIGQRSVRVHAGRGTVLEESGSKHTLPPATAANGIAITPLALLARIADSRTSFIDQGAAVIGTVTLHRVTMAFPAFSTDDSTAVVPTCIVDLYFDDKVHMLSKSAAYIQLGGRDRAHYMQVVTYSAYKAEKGATVAHQVSLTLNGQPCWTLQLTSITINPTVAKGFFHF